MSSYCIEYGTIGKYEAVVYATSFLNPFDETRKIETDVRDRIPNGGFLLFDMLLSNGDSFNRFAEAYYDGNKIRKNTINVVDVGKPQMKLFDAHYRGRARELNNSVLSPRERLKYCKA